MFRAAFDHRADLSSLSHLQLYNRLPSMRFATAAIVQFTFSAATTFLLSLARAHKLGQRKKAQTAREALDTCVTYLKMAGNPCVNARQCWTILERLLKEYGLDGAGKGENERARKQGFGKDFEEEARFPSNSVRLHFKTFPCDSAH